MSLRQVRTLTHYERFIVDVMIAGLLPREAGQCRRPMRYCCAVVVIVRFSAATAAATSASSFCAS